MHIDLPLNAYFCLNFDGFGPGTSSTREALAIVLKGKCYHMADVFMGTKQDWDFWERALEDIDRDEKQI